MDDQNLLSAFAETGDPDAFRQIVDRHIRAVHSAAKRQVRDPHLAEDVTQAVFIMLARKAGSIRQPAALAGWLVKAANLAAKAALRNELRLKAREQRAAAMNPSSNPSPEPFEDDATLRQLQLDDALVRLGPADRAVVTLRFLEDRPIREVAQVLGATEEVTRKRLSRAVAKLRRLVSRRGAAPLTSLSLCRAMHQQAGHALPPHLIESTTRAALAKAEAAATAITAAAIAHAALSAARWQSIVRATAVAAVLIGVTVIATAAARRVAPSSLTAIAAPSPTTPLPSNRIKVGVYLSRNTAVQRGSNGTLVWGSQFPIVDELKPWTDLDLQPLIEPGTASDPQLAYKLQFYFPGKTALDVTDPAALKQLDVIIVCSVCFPTDEALAAVEASVRDGRGLLVRQCFGGDNSGYARPAVRHLRLLDEAEPDALRSIKSGSATVVGQHPLLGDLSGLIGKPLQVQAYGGYGKLLPGAIPLIKMNGTDSVVFDRLGKVKEHPGYGIYPLVVGQLGAGRIVSCAFGDRALPASLDTATGGGKFSARAVRWAAGRPLQ